MPMNRLSAQKGNAFFIVLLGIALFAGLSFVVSRSMRSETTERLSNREIKLAATEIIEYGSRFERTVSKLRRRGCSENDLNFEGNQDFSRTVDDEPFVYRNNNSPDDFSCHVFHPDGGNLQPRLPVPIKATVNIDDLERDDMHPQSFKVTASRIEGHGSDSGPNGTDLILIIGRLTEGVCAGINAELGIDLDDDDDQTPLDTWNCEEPFTGEYSNCSDSIGDSVSAFESKTAFCVDNGENGGTGLMYVQLLIPR